ENDVLQLAGVRRTVRIGCRAKRIAKRVYGCDRRRRPRPHCLRVNTESAARPAWPVTEDSMLRTVGKRSRTRGLAVTLELLVEKGEKESLILYDRPPHAAGKFIAIDPGRLARRPLSIDDLFIVAPGIRVELGVSNGPEAGAVKLVGAGTGQDLNLAIAAPQFRVNRCENYPHFTDHVGMQHGNRSDAIRITAVLNAQPITDGIDH